jgi:hypothetical protein
MVIVVIDVSVVVGIYRFSAIVAVAIIVAVDAFKRIIANLACMTAIYAQM